MTSFKISRAIGERNSVRNNIMESSTHSYYIMFGSLLIGGLAVVCFTKSARNSNQNTKENKKETIEIVPYAKVGIIETILELGNRDAPLFLLKHLRFIQRTYNGLSSYRFFIPLVPGFCLYVVGDIQTQRQILLDPTTDKDPSVYGPINTIVGVNESIFTSTSNAHWKLVRKVTASAFANKHIDRMKHITIHHTERWLDNIKQHKMKLNNDKQKLECIIDPSIEMVSLTFQIICEAAFEYTDVTINDYYKFAKNLEIALIEYDMKQVVNPLRPYFKWFIPEVQAAENASIELQQFGYQMLYSYRNNHNKCQDNITLIKLIDSIDTISDSQKVAEILVFLVAGHDTTGYSIASTLLLLAKHPTVFYKLKDDTQDLLPEQWSKSCMYFTSIIKETFRYAPVAAFGAVRYLHKDFYVTTTTPPTNITDTTQPHDVKTYKIPKYSTVFLPQILSHRDSNVFGTSCDTFDPDRWIITTNDNTTTDTTNISATNTIASENITKSEATTIDDTHTTNTITNDGSSNSSIHSLSKTTTTLLSSSTTNNNNSIMPFAMGLRNCAGKSFAMTELETILPLILSQIDDIQMIQEGKLNFFLTWKYINSLICISIDPKKKATRMNNESAMRNNQHSTTQNIENVPSTIHISNTKYEI